ncbi:reverse transcriptase domain-containing protein [Tanacetum coccineum]
MLSGFFKTKVSLQLQLLWYLPLYPVIPSQTQGVKFEPLRLEADFLFYTTYTIPPPLYDENEPLTEKETEVTKDKVLPSTKDIQPPVIQKSQDPVKPVSSPISPEPSSAQVDNSPPSKEPSKKNRLPYPSRVEHEKKGENDKVQIQKFWEMFKKIHVDITLADALILVPKYQKMLKSLLSNKEKLNEMANTPVSETCSAIILKKLPEKLGDPGQFLIPCNFSELKCKALADLGASINLMPFSVYTKLGLPALQSTRMTLELANCSLCVPKGIARDVLVPTHWSLIDVHGEELVIRDGLERIVFKPDGSQDNESIHMMDVYDDRVKDVCEPESNDDSATSAIVDEFESLLGDIIKQKEELKGISDPVARRRAKIISNEFGDSYDREKRKMPPNGLLEDENSLEMNDKKLDHLETTSYVGSDYVFYEDFNLVDMIFPMNIQGKIFDPGITFHGKSFEKDAFNDKSSKELAPSKALLTLDVFDPLHPPLMDFNVTKAFFGFTFSILKFFSKKFSGFWKLHGSILWKDKAIPTISIDDLQSSLHKWENSNLLSLSLSN